MAYNRYIANSVEEGVNNAIGGAIISFYWWRLVFAFTTPANIISSFVIGVSTNGYIGWGLFILNQILALTWSWIHILLTIAMCLVAAAFAQ